MKVDIALLHKKINEHHANSTKNIRSKVSNKKQLKHCLDTIELKKTKDQTVLINFIALLKRFDPQKELIPGNMQKELSRLGVYPIK